MTQDQFALLQDKIALWRRVSIEGVTDLRDYNRRSAEALTVALVERARALEVIEGVKDWLMKDSEKSHIGPDDMRVYHLDGGVLGNMLDEVRAILAEAKQ